MPRTRMTAALGILLGLATFLHAGPAKDPQRVVNQRTVDLTPLFHWWTNHSGERPLKAWVHLTGSVIATNAYGWELDGQTDSVTDSASHHKSQSQLAGYHLLLRDPPASDKALFERLSAELATLKSERTNVVAKQQQAKQAVNVASHSSGSARVRSARSAQARSAEAYVTRDLHTVDTAIANVKKQLAAFPDPQHYVVDCFALETGQRAATLPVYDYGTVFPK